MTTKAHKLGFEQGYQMARELEHLRKRVDRVVSNKKNPYSKEVPEFQEFEAGYRAGMRSKEGDTYNSVRQ